jgi:ABC-type glycerol-3-phosphate transport system permease component
MKKTFPFKIFNRLKIFNRRSKEKRTRVFGKSVSSNIVFGLTLFILLVVCAAQLYPVLWMLSASVKSDFDLYNNMFGFPVDFHFHNYSDVLYLLRADILIPGKGFVSYGFGRLLLNSVILSLIGPVAGFFSVVPFAYIMARYKFKGRGFFMTLNYIIMILPITGALPSQLKIYHALGMYNNVVLLNILGAMPFGLQMLIYLGFFKGVAGDYAEAAEIDGAGQFRIFLQIMLPAVLPAIAVFYIMGVLGKWNDYMTPLIWLPSFPNLALGVFQFQYDAAKYAATLPQIMAVFVVVSIPSVFFFVTNQRLMTSKLMVGGLKG